MCWLRLPDALHRRRRHPGEDEPGLDNSTKLVPAQRALIIESLLTTYLLLSAGYRATFQCLFVCVMCNLKNRSAAFFLSAARPSPARPRVSCVKLVRSVDRRQRRPTERAHE